MKEKRLRLTPKQQYIVDEMRSGKTIAVSCDGKYYMHYETHFDDGNCPTCGQDIPREVIPKRTFDAMVKKGVLVPSTYWIANVYSEDGD